jgi:hypothetical protein
VRERDARGRFVSAAPPPIMRRRRRRVSLPQEWPLYIFATVLAVALGLVVGRFA